MAVVRKKSDDKYLKALRELITTGGGNRQCFDCGQKGPTYVNMTIGSFVCTRCSGVLRGLTPPHRIKSISMATFTQEELDFLKAHGNDVCGKTWLGLWDPKRAIHQDHRELMIDKYERKRYYLEPASPLKSLTSIHNQNGNNNSNNTAALTNGYGNLNNQEQNHQQIQLTPPNSHGLATISSTDYPKSNNQSRSAVGKTAIPNGTALNRPNIHHNHNKNNNHINNIKTNSNNNKSNNNSTAANNNNNNTINNNNNNNNSSHHHDLLGLSLLNGNGLKPPSSISSASTGALSDTSSCTSNGFGPDSDFVADFNSANIYDATSLNRALSGGANGPSNVTPVTSNGYAKIQPIKMEHFMNGGMKSEMNGNNNNLQSTILNGNGATENFADFDHAPIYNAVEFKNRENYQFIRKPNIRKLKNSNENKFNHHHQEEQIQQHQLQQQQQQTQNIFDRIIEKNETAFGLKTSSSTVLLQPPSLTPPPQLSSSSSSSSVFPSTTRAIRGKVGGTTSTSTSTLNLKNNRNSDIIFSESTSNFNDPFDDFNNIINRSNKPQKVVTFDESVSDVNSNTNSNTNSSRNSNSNIKSKSNINKTIANETAFSSPFAAPLNVNFNSNDLHTTKNHNDAYNNDYNYSFNDDDVDDGDDGDDEVFNSTNFENFNTTSSKNLTQQHKTFTPLALAAHATAMAVLANNQNHSAFNNTNYFFNNNNNSSNNKNNNNNNNSSSYSSSSNNNNKSQMSNNTNSMNNIMSNNNNEPNTNINYDTSDIFFYNSFINKTSNNYLKSKQNYNQPFTSDDNYYDKNNNNNTDDDLNNNEFTDPNHLKILKNLYWPRKETTWQAKTSNFAEISNNESSTATPATAPPTIIDATKEFSPNLDVKAPPSLTSTLSYPIYPQPSNQIKSFDSFGIKEENNYDTLSSYYSNGRKPSILASTSNSIFNETENHHRLQWKISETLISSQGYGSDLSTYPNYDDSNKTTFSEAKQLIMVTPPQQYQQSKINEIEQEQQEQQQQQQQQPSLSSSSSSSFVDASLSYSNYRPKFSSTNPFLTPFEANDTTSSSSSIHESNPFYNNSNNSNNSNNNNDNNHNHNSNDNYVSNDFKNLNQTFLNSTANEQNYNSFAHTTSYLKTSHITSLPSSTPPPNCPSNPHTYSYPMIAHTPSGPQPLNTNVTENSNISIPFCQATKTTFSNSNPKVISNTDSNSNFISNSNNKSNSNSNLFNCNSRYNESNSNLPSASLPIQNGISKHSAASSANNNNNNNSNATPGEDRYAALKDLDEQLRESKAMAEAAASIVSSAVVDSFGNLNNNNKVNTANPFKVLQQQQQQQQQQHQQQQQSGVVGNHLVANPFQTTSNPTQQATNLFGQMTVIPNGLGMVNGFPTAQQQHQYQHQHQHQHQQHQHQQHQPPQGFFNYSNGFAVTTGSNAGGMFAPVSSSATNLMSGPNGCGFGFGTIQQQITATGGVNAGGAFNNPFGATGTLNTNNPFL